MTRSTSEMEDLMSEQTQSPETGTFQLTLPLAVGLLLVLCLIASAAV